MNVLGAEAAASGMNNPVMWVLVGVGVVLVLFVIASYNKLVKLRMKVKSSWSDIDVQLQRRYELIPNLVEIAKGYMKHEKELLENVTAARGGALKALEASHGGPTAELASAESMLGGLMRNLMISVEAYPDLKANTNMMQLSEEVTSTENKIAFSRNYYNDRVGEYNTKTELFPTNIFASMMGFKQANFFEVENRGEASKAPKVEF